MKKQNSICVRIICIRMLGNALLPKPTLFSSCITVEIGDIDLMKSN